MRLDSIKQTAMRGLRFIAAFALLLCSPTDTVSAQISVAWRDPSPHKTQFVTVDDGVKLEVLDWGGSGRPLVLVAGLGNTAHVFDDFAPKLTSENHVYGLTRRGFGASSKPAIGYSADRLGDDVLEVIAALKLDRPLLVGHSIGGEELSSVGSRHPEKVAGLIYLDAAYAYAYYDSLQGDFILDLQDLQKKLAQMRSADDLSGQKPLIKELLQTSLPGFESDTKSLQEEIDEFPPDPKPTASDLESFEKLRLWQERVYGAAVPEAELRQIFESTPAGHLGGYKPDKALAVFWGRQKYTKIPVPVLAIFAIPQDLGPFLNSDPVARAAFDAKNIAVKEPRIKAFENGVPSARVVRLQHANHYIFISNEADVLREMHTFIKSLH